jgi:hypothetical protein
MGIAGLYLRVPDSSGLNRTVFALKRAEGKGRAPRSGGAPTQESRRFLASKNGTAMSVKMSDSSAIKIRLDELKGLLFWAAVGIEESMAGTAIDETVLVIRRYSSRYALQVDTPKIGRLFKKRRPRVKQISVRLDK